MCVLRLCFQVKPSREGERNLLAGPRAPQLSSHMLAVWSLSPVGWTAHSPWAPVHMTSTSAGFLAKSRGAPKVSLQLSPNERAAARARAFEKMSKQELPPTQRPLPPPRQRKPLSWREPSLHEQALQERVIEKAIASDAAPQTRQAEHSSQPALGVDDLEYKPQSGDDNDSLRRQWEASLIQFLDLSRRLTQASVAAVVRRAYNAPGRWSARLLSREVTPAWTETGTSLPPLPPGWHAMYDEATRLPYYVSPDGVSMWTRPEGVPEGMVTTYPALPPAPAPVEQRLTEETINNPSYEMSQAEKEYEPLETSHEPMETSMEAEDTEDPDYVEASDYVEAVGPLRRSKEEALAIKNAWALKAAKQMSGR